MRWFYLFTSTLFLLTNIGISRAEDPSPDYFELQERIKRLERRLNKIDRERYKTGGVTAPGTAIPKAEPTTPEAPGRATAPGVRAPRSTGSSADSAFATVTGLSRTFNPAISVNGLFQGNYRSIGNNDPNADFKTGLQVREVEVQFTANVDTYLRANIRFTFEDDQFELEEGFVDVLLLNRLALRAGQFYSNFGKHNLLHTHQFPFIDAPLVNQRIFGDEALLEVGAGLNYLVPVPWYSELIFQFLEGDNPNLFNAPLNDDFAYLVHTKNLWDLNEDTTLEWGASYVTGRNNVAAQGSGNSTSQAAGTNLTIKWKPARRLRYKTLVWQTEYIGAWQETGVNTLTGLKNPDDNRGGLYTFLQYQFRERWWVQGRYDYFGFHQPAPANKEQQYTALLGYVPSEFSAIRLQYSYLNQDISEEHRVMLQLNFSMGSHPAHMY